MDDMERMKQELDKFFKKTMIKGHKCIFTGKKIKLKDMMKDEKQFRLCVMCRLCSVIVSVSFLAEGLKKLRTQLKRDSEEENKKEIPFYIG